MKKIKKRKLLAMLLSLLASIAIFILLLEQLRARESQYQYVEVVCAKVDLKAGQLLEVEDLEQYVETIEIPEYLLIQSYVIDPLTLEGGVLLVDLEKGAMISQDFYQKKEEWYQEYQDLVWITVSASQLEQSVAGTIRSGDYIDIYVMEDQEEEYRSKILLEGIRVRAVYTEQGVEIETNDSIAIAKLFEIPVERTQVAAIFLGLEEGKVRIAKYNDQK